MTTNVTTAREGAMTDQTTPGVEDFSSLASLYAGVDSIREPAEDWQARALRAERRLVLRTRQLKTCGDNWCVAAEQALAGSPNSLRIRIGMHREPPVDVVLSEARP